MILVTDCCNAGVGASRSALVKRTRVALDVVQNKLLTRMGWSVLVARWPIVFSSVCTARGVLFSFST